MNFFAQQERSRTHTRRMLILFVVAVVSIVAAVDIVVLIAFGAFGSRHAHSLEAARGAPPLALFLSSLAVLAVVAGATMYKISTLRSGGAAVARQFGATPISADSSNFAYRRLRNVVEEIAIASGVPVPEIYVLEDEPAINAFAAGYTPADAAITVTRGCLDKLTRDELQGVIAHEFSHVLNGDMRLNIRLMGVLFGILVIGIAGRKLVENTGRSKDSGGIVAFGVAILAIGYLGVFFGRLIKAGISRQREYLADASAVQFTRQTLGIGGALKKIGGLAEGSKLASAETEEVAHMLFGDGVGYSALFATHPPLLRRIKLLDPQFNPQEFQDIARAWSRPVAASDAEAADVSIAGFAPAVAIARHAPAAARATPVPQSSSALGLSADRIAEQAGSLEQADITSAGALRTGVPEALRAAARSPERSMQVIFAMALSADSTVRLRQLAMVEKYTDPATRTGIEDISALLPQLRPALRLPLAQMAFPALRRRPRPALQSFLVALNHLIQADGQLALEEYCLGKLIAVQVVDALDPSRASPTGSVKLPACADELSDIFSIVAQNGSDDPADAQRAYLLGMHEVLPDAIPVYAPPSQWSQALDRAFERLDLLVPAGKELVVRGLAQTIGADAVVTVREAELLRTICAALHCPLPPIAELAA